VDREKLLEDYLLFHTDPEWRAAAIEIWVIISLVVCVCLSSFEVMISIQVQ